MPSEAIKADGLEDTLAGVAAVVIVNWKKLDGQTRAAVLGHALAMIELASPTTARVLPFRRRH